MARSDSQLVGAMGETIVLYELMYQDWVPANVNAFVRNARNIDIVAIKGKRQVALSVKTSGPSSNSNFKLGGAPETPIFNQHDGAVASHVCFVILSNTRSQGYQVYVVPVHVAEKRIQEADLHWRKGMKRDGSPRKPGIRGIRFSGRETEGNIAAGFAVKWKKYLNAWDQLDKKASP